MTELLTSPTFYTDLLKIPSKDQKKFTKAVPLIQADPFTGGGKSKKCFKFKYSNVYRHRIGDYRIIYCVGNKCIRLLTVAHRNSVYDRFGADPDYDLPPPEELGDAKPQPIPTISFDEPKEIPPKSGEDQGNGAGTGKTHEAMANKGRTSENKFNYDGRYGINKPCHVKRA